MATTLDISDAHVLMFTKNVELALQQNESVLKSAVKNVTCYGEGAQAALIFGSVEMQPFVTGTAAGNWYGATTAVAVEHKQRWMTPIHRNLPIYLSPEDKIEMIIDPSGAYVDLLKTAYNRAVDNTIISALSGTATEGKFDDRTTVAFPTSQVIGDGTTALTLDMIIDARMSLDEGEIDQNADKYFVVAAKQLGQLLKDPTITSADYNNVRALVAGEINTFMGFKWIRTQLLPLAGTVRECFAFSKPCVQLGNWNNLVVKQDVRPDLNYVNQLYATATMGACRVQDAGVVAVNCLEG